MMPNIAIENLDSGSDSESGEESKQMSMQKCKTTVLKVRGGLSPFSNSKFPYMLLVISYF